MDLNKKRILVIGINCLPELTGIGRYTGEMLNWMVKQGHEVTMVTAFPYYPQWKIQAPHSGKFYRKEDVNKDKFSIYRCPLYVPSDPTGAKRLLHEASFFFSAFFVIFRLLFKKRHDLIFSIAPPFHLGFLSLFYRFFRGGKIVYHIQDLQVDAAKELKMLPEAFFFVLFGLERFILKQVNYVSTISDGMIQKIKEKVNQRVLFFPNWVDTFNYYSLDNRENLKKEWGFASEDKIVLYSGSIGEKQGLDVLIRIADNLKESPHIRIVICGTGPYKEKLMSMSSALSLQNIYFLPLQEDEVFNKFLNMADVHLVLQKGDASDLVMPSKLTTILSVGGLALVTANTGTTLNEVISINKMGIVINGDNESLLEATIKDACLQDYSSYRENARLYAEKFLNKDNILNKILSDLE